MEKLFRVIAIILVLIFVTMTCQTSAYAGKPPSDGPRARDRYEEVVNRYVEDVKNRNERLGSSLGDFSRNAQNVLRVVTAATIGVGIICIFIPGGQAVGAGLIITGVVGSMMTDPALHEIERMSGIIEGNPTASDYEVVASIKPVDTFEPDSDTLFMGAKSDYLKKLAELEQINQAYIDSFSRMQVAFDAGEMHFALLQAISTKSFIEKCKDNLTEQKELISIINFELIKGNAFENIHEEGIEFEFDFELAIKKVRDMSSRGIDQDEHLALLDAGLTKEDIGIIESALTNFNIEEDRTIDTLEDLSAETNKIMEVIDIILIDLDNILDLSNIMIAEIQRIVANDLEIAKLYDTGGGGGGGVYIDQNSTATLKGNYISDNSANFGGGVFVGSGSSANLDGNNITANNATWGAGLLFFLESEAKVYDNIIDSNHALLEGGGIWTSIDSELEFGVLDKNTYQDNVSENIYYENEASDNDEL